MKKISAIVVALMSLGIILVTVLTRGETSPTEESIKVWIIMVGLLVLLLAYDIKTIIPISWIAFIAATIFFSRDDNVGGLIFTLSIYALGIYEVVKDQYLTTKEKGWCILLVLTLSIVGVCITQLIASSKMKKRFKLNMDLNEVEPVN